MTGEQSRIKYISKYILLAVIVAAIELLIIIGAVIAFDLAANYKI